MVDDDEVVGDQLFWVVGRSRFGICSHESICAEINEFILGPHARTKHIIKCLCVFESNLILGTLHCLHN